MAATTGDDIIDGTNEDDSLSGQAGDDVINGLGGDDTLRGNTGDDTLDGGDGDDILDGGDGQDTLIGGPGDDTYNIDDDLETIIETLSQDAGGGDDRVTATVGFTLPSNVETLVLGGEDAIDGTGNSEPNSIVGNGFDNILSGLDGDDTLTGNGGDDTLIGGDGDDQLRGSLGADTLIGGNGSDRYNVTDANDTIIEEANDEGTDTIRTSVDLTIADNVERLVLVGSATSGTGNDDDNTLRGNGFDNVLTGLGGDDEIEALKGNDLLDGGLGTDLLDAGEGDDRLLYSGEDAGGDDTMLGGDGDDTFEIRPTSTGLSALLTLDGGAGDDTLELLADGLASVDFTAGSGNDRASLVDETLGSATLDMGEGDDLVELGRLNDVDGFLGGAITLTLGAGVDTVVLADVPDSITITDFETGASGDILDFTPLIPGLSNFGGGNPFGTGHLQLIQDGDDALLQGDRDGGADGFETLVRFENADASAFVFQNFSGFATDGSPPIGITVTGTPDDDVLTGTIGEDTINGLAGDDLLTGLEDDDILNGGDGDDVLDGGAGADVLAGGDGLDWALYVDAAAPIVVRLWNQTISGDIATGDTLSGIESIATGDGDDTLIGSSDDNILAGADGDDKLDGLGGDDLIAGGAGADELIGGRGNDTVFYGLATGGVTVRLWSQTASGDFADGDTLSGFENVIGGAGDDILIGDNGTGNVLEGGDGNDKLDGLGGDDLLIGGLGADQLFGGAGIDTASYEDATEGLAVRLWRQTLIGEETPSGGTASGDTLKSIENVIGGFGNDVLIGDNGVQNQLEGGDGDDKLDGLGGDDVLIGGAGADELVGGNGFDTASYRDASSQVVARLWNQSITGDVATGDTLDSIENLIGGSAGDILIGSNVANRLEGGDGDDKLDGLGGDDLLIGGVGADELFGGAGNDTLAYMDAGGQVVVRLWNQTATGDGASGDQIDGFENVVGGRGNDALIGDNGVNILGGGAGNDYLDGLGGDDVLVSGAGNDRSIGGSGADTFVVSAGADVILDFSALEGDRLDVSQFEGVNSLIALEEAHEQVGDDSVFTFADGSTLTVEDTTIDDFASTLFANDLDDVFV